MRAGRFAVAVATAGVGRGQGLARGSVGERLQRRERRIRDPAGRFAARGRTIVEPEGSAASGSVDGSGGAAPC